MSTRLTFEADAERVWETLAFYEQLEARPPLFMRLLLPVPIGTEGRKSVPGDEALCRYAQGHLIKRVTAAERAKRYAFDVIEQRLEFGGGVRLSGGSYTLRALPSGGTEVELATRYESPRRPRWLWRPIEAAVCHLFHRHILKAMRGAAVAPSHDPAPGATT